MAVNKGEIGIYGVLRRDGGNNILAKTDQIQDARTNKTQEEVNQEAFVLSTRVNDINIRVEGLESKISKPINYKNILENKNALDALTGVKHGDMYQVRSAIVINDKKYPENTKFVYVSTHENGVSDGWWEPFNSITLSTKASPLSFDNKGNIILRISSGLKLGGGNDLGLDDDKLVVKISSNYSGLNFNNSGDLQLSTGSIRVDSNNRIKILYGDGLKIGDDYKLRLNLISSPLYFDNSKHIFIRCGSGLKVGTVDDEDNKLLINHGYSISVNSGKVDVNCGQGLFISTKGLNIQCGSGLNVDANVLAIECGNSVDVNSGTNKLNVKLAQNSGLNIGDNGLNVKLNINSNDDIVPNLLRTNINGIYISSSKLAEFIKQVMATP